MSTNINKRYEVLSRAWKLLMRYPLCDHCLGRQFHLLNEEESNEVLGNSIKQMLFLELKNILRSNRRLALGGLRALGRSGYRAALFELSRLVRKETKPESCYICGDTLFNKIDEIVSSICQIAKNYEFKTFQVGSSLPKRVIKLDDEIKMKYKLIHGENIKTEFNRLIQYVISEKLGKIYSFQEPDVMILIEPLSSRVQIAPNPIYIYGRYRKLQTGISQTRKIEDPLKSIEGMLASILVPMFFAKDVKFHGAGREDIDAKMLGPGRPFIIEIIDPKKRNVEVDEISKKFNERYSQLVEISALRTAKKAEISRLKLKSEKLAKLYHIIVNVPSLPSEVQLKKLEQEMKGLVIYQRTPRRVLWRRADKVRKRMINWIKVIPLPPNKLDITIEAQAGTYIKEFISGDEDRTKPSLSELLGMPAQCDILEVIDIID